MNRKRKITADEYHVVCEMLNQLTEILLVVGVVELKISKKDKEIFWDTENGAQVDSKELMAFSELIESHYLDLAQQPPALAAPHSAQEAV